MRVWHRQWLQGHAHRCVITLGDPDYPQRLLQTADPPLLLYVQGRLDLLGADSVAVVGSRQPTPQGASNARLLARQLSERGITVVSGLAQGIDGAAHDGALEGPGSTVAVVGTGLDIVYPSRHKALARRIAEQGVLVSEYAPGTPPLPEHFPQRNRIIAGLSLGTLVVEAALRSGSLITARLALEAGRDVLCHSGVDPRRAVARAAMLLDQAGRQTGRDRRRHRRGTAPGGTRRPGPPRQHRRTR